MSKIKEIAPEKIFLILSLVFGLLFVFITPPFQSPDENSHFLKAYSVSKGKFFPEVQNKKLGNYFPKEYLNYIKEKEKYSTNFDKKYSYKEFYNDQLLKINYKDVEFSSYATQETSPVFYIVPALGMLFGKILMRIFNITGAGPAFLLYCARIASLLFSTFIIYQAIKISPKFKKTISAICLVPMTLFLFSMVTYDNLLIPMSILGIVLMLKLIYDKKYIFTKKNILMLGLISFILLNLKVFYSFIFILIFFIPKEKFKFKNKKVLCIILFAASIILISTLFKIPNILINKNIVVTNSPSNLGYLLHHPFKYMSVLYNSIIDNRLFLLCSVIGVFGLLDSYLPIVIIFFYYIYLLIVFFVDGNGIKVDKKIKVFLLIGSFFAFAGIFTAMYISWTPVVVKENATQTISGVQGRYFIPLMFPIAIIFSNNIKNNSFFEKVRKGYIIYPFICLLLTVFVLIIRFWI